MDELYLPMVGEIVPVFLNFHTAYFFVELSAGYYLI